MWRILLVATACGRVDFAPVPDAGAAAYDFTGLVPYVEDDFADDDGSFRDNAPVALTELPDGFAVSVGRAIVHLGFDGSREVHDYRPVMAGGGGPDEIVKLTYGDGMLWVASTSILDGDGVYLVDAAWQMARDNNVNNVGGIALDVAEQYFTAGNKGVLRRSDQAVVVAFSTDMASLALAPGGMFVVDGDPGGPDRLWFVAGGVRTMLESSDSEQLADRGGSADGVLVIQNLTDLVRVASDGTRTPISSAPAGIEYRDAAVMSDGRIAVLEFEPAFNGERVVILP